MINENKENGGGDFNLNLFISRAIVCLVILVAGVGLLLLLASLKKEPSEKKYVETEIQIRVIKASITPVDISFLQYGTAQSIREVILSSEVSGRITSLNINIQKGCQVVKGESLLTIDNSNYKTTLTLTQASVDSTVAEIKRTELSLKNDMKRLVVLSRDHKLSLNKLERTKKLFIKNVDSQMEVDRSEQEVAQKENIVLSLQTTIALYPSKLNILNAQLRSGKASLLQAQHDIERCNIIAPFTGRVVDENLELNQYIRATTPLITIADDTMIEIPVSIYGGDLVKMGIKAGTNSNSKHWVEGFDKIKANICWTGTMPETIISGKINRIEKYDETTRMAILIIRPDKSDQSFKTPLIPGMFCKVKLSSNIKKQLIAIPRSSIQFEGKVFVVDKEDRLNERKIDIFYRTEDKLFIDKGINNGEKVVTSKLPFSLIEGMKVNIIETE